MKTYTVKQLATISGVSVRALHHYDEIGLLKPAHVGDNGYRYYGRDELLRLQQILFHREFGVPLKDIAALLARAEADRIPVLKEHRARLDCEARRYRQLIRTIDRTIAELQGESEMKHADLYKGFSPQKQAAYEAELVDRFGGDMRQRIDESAASLKRLSKADRERLMRQLPELEAAVADSLRRGEAAGSETLEPVIARHRAWVAAMWGRACPPDAYAGLADLYTSHPDFRTRYETLQPGLTDYLAAAMKAHAARA
jgi:DNA-binding transcriptional MerR regulator